MFARTDRLLLRPGWAEDAAALHAGIADEAVCGKLARAPWPYAMADAEAFLAQPGDARLPSLLAFAREPGAPRLIGGIGLQLDADGEAELGYWCARDQWGRGYATEAGRAMLGIARALGWRRLVSGHFVDNPASGRVLRKLGFVPTGRVAARASRARGRLVPTVLFALALEESARRPIAA